MAPLQEELKLMRDEFSKTKFEFKTFNQEKVLIEKKLHTELEGIDKSHKKKFRTKIELISRSHEEKFRIELKTITCNHGKKIEDIDKCNWF